MLIKRKLGANAVNKYFLSVLCILTACATPPDQIKPVADNRRCTQNDRDRLADISANQKKNADRDALGVFLVGVPLGKDDDHAPEIARLKGRCGVK
ncbi:hypothetical protein [Mesorhizobium sp. KR9-304]|uniref:hypothetical protein n=1 Tax=Mesorhizobium sp. KR9-304 TaxID=3156614 RepID=UPI0032B4509B